MTPQGKIDRLKEACGKVTISGAPQGTGFLIAPRQVVTCEHVVHNLDAESLQFECTEEKRKVSDVKVDPALDCAILLLDKPLNNEPLKLWSSGTPTSNEWISYGFPLFSNFNGHVCKGEVRDARATDDRGVKSLQLYTDDLAAGLGQPLHGLSGAPVVSEGLVIGHVKKGVSDTRFIPTNPAAAGARPQYSAAGGVIYASPAFSVLKLLGENTTVAERRVMELAAEDLKKIREALVKFGNDLTNIEAYGDRCTKWRYVPGLLAVRAHQVNVARGIGYEQYARALEQLGTAHYLAGDEALADRIWSDAEAIYEKQVNKPKLVVDFREAVRNTRLLKSGWLRQPP